MLSAMQPVSEEIEMHIETSEYQSYPGNDIEKIVPDLTVNPSRYPMSACLFLCQSVCLSVVVSFFVYSLYTVFVFVDSWKIFFIAILFLCYLSNLACVCLNAERPMRLVFLTVGLLCFLQALLNITLRLGWKEARDPTETTCPNLTRKSDWCVSQSVLLAIIIVIEVEEPKRITN